MLGHLAALEIESRKLEPTEKNRAGLNKMAMDYADGFLDKIYTNKAYTVTSDKGRGIRGYKITEEGTGMDKLLDAIAKHVDRPGLNPASGGHLGYIPGGGVFPAALGDYLAAISNRYAGVFFGSPGAVEMENLLLDWMRDLFGFPEGTIGNLTSGGSIASLIGIVTARDARKINAGNIRNSVIYLTEQVHHAIDKSIRIAGLSECIIRRVPMDDRFRMDAGELDKLLAKDQTAGRNPFLIIGSVGTTDTGAIDPVADLAGCCKNYNCWLHLDAAYGGFFALVPGMKAQLGPLYLADSLVIDPHKGLFLPYGIGAVLVKDREAMMQSHHYVANYMQDAAREAEVVSPADVSPELTKHFRGMRMWLPLKLLGLSPFRAALEEKVLLCQYFYTEVQKIENIEVGPFPELSVLIFRYVAPDGDDNRFNELLVRYVKEDGRVFLSSTMIGSRFWIRLAVLSFRTHKDTIDLAIQVLKEGIAKIETT